ncbi:AI-2E family transporter [Candidatus Micrarchaeota archaeon]|nr:AI-2E family transporter [Candidatus Micrarchaeota archaeon]
MKIANEKKYFALLILALLAFFLLFAFLPLLAGISGAAIIYVLFKPLYLKLLNRTKNKTVSAVSVIVLSFVLIIIPLSYLAYLFFAEVGYILADAQQITDTLAPFAAYLGYDSAAITALIMSHVDVLAAFVSGISIVVVEAVVSFTLNVVVLYLLLYYALTENEKATKTMQTIIPFSEKNANRLMKEFSHVINTTFIGNGAASIVLGVLLAAGLAYLGSNHFFFWVLAGTIMAFIPIIGIQVIWIPAAAYYLITGNYPAGIGILLWGAFLSYIFDGFVRQRVQRQVGEMHPLISLIGLIIGIMYFGVTGIIIGPLILAVFVLMAQMFREEYLPGW